jgi:hypothetical protein
MSTACLPFFWASPTALRTSAAVATMVPPTSRMTSPLLSPCSEESPSRQIDSRRGFHQLWRKRIGGTEIAENALVETETVPLNPYDRVNKLSHAGFAA